MNSVRTGPGEDATNLNLQHAQAWRAKLFKLALWIAGLLLLGRVSSGWVAPACMLAVTGASYWLGCWLRNTAPSRTHQFINRSCVPLAFILLVAMNVMGLIGTLTGSQQAPQDAMAGAWIAMPFYLLAAAAFVADMSARRLAQPHWLDYGVYVALPFKLLAGPLEPPSLLGQIARIKPRFRRVHGLAAWPWVALGAFMKYVIANRLMPARHLVEVDPVVSLITAAVFELKFYFDFAGYSFMAYGGALALGLRINQNFNHPFLARNVVLFWRAWHMSLGRFLTRYVLEPNLGLWRGRSQKMLFASSIFLVSAMWHGGTLNYLLWGLFHAACYYGYGQWLKTRSVPFWVGTLTMLWFFVLGRMLAIDADGSRLLLRLTNLFDWHCYVTSQCTGYRLISEVLTLSEVKALVAALLFIVMEVLSVRWFRRPRGYHLMRRPVSAFLLTIGFVVFGMDAGNLLYARI